MLDLATGAIVQATDLDVLEALPDCSIDLVYADPPFNTGRTQRGARLRTTADEQGDRTGFAGRRYATVREELQAFADNHDDYLAYLRPRLEQTRRVLAPHGTFYLHLDPRESHYAKVMLDGIFGRECFLNEVIWAYDYGGRTKRRWPPKHDVLLVYVKDPQQYHFDADAVGRIPYMAPGLVTAEKVARGKLPTDVWWHTIVPTSSPERTGYPTQKPLGILRRVISSSSRQGALVLDWCAGSGTTGVAANELGRRFLLVDSSADAVTLMRGRLGAVRGLRVCTGAAELLS